MIAIEKNNPPEIREQLKTIAKEMGVSSENSFSLLRGDDKNAVKNILMKEQGYICVLYVKNSCVRA